MYAVSAPNVLRWATLHPGTDSRAGCRPVGLHHTGAPLTPDQAAILTARIGLETTLRPRRAHRPGRRRSPAVRPRRRHPWRVRGPAGADDNYVTDAEKAGAHPATRPHWISCPVRTRATRSSRRGPRSRANLPWSRRCDQQTPAPTQGWASAATTTGSHGVLTTAAQGRRLTWRCSLEAALDRTRTTVRGTLTRRHWRTPTCACRTRSCHSLTPPARPVEHGSVTVAHRPPGGTGKRHPVDHPDRPTPMLT